MMKTLLFLLVALLLAGTVIATQPTQQYNKIFLSPFYRNSMTANTDYSYQLLINPPDGFSQTITAILTLDAWITPTVTITALVNGKSCNNPSYLIHTTYASAGRGVVTFDCSNLITAAGNYTVTFRSSGANLGASTAWVELTYLNNPDGAMHLAGTEYRVGDDATIFLQLKDNQDEPVTNGTCSLSIFSPFMNGTHPNFLLEAPMFFLDTNDGLYYYDLVVPNTSGVFMLSAKCAYAQNTAWVYALDGMDAPNRTGIYGTYDGSTVALVNKEDFLYEHCTSQPVSGMAFCDAYYDFNLSGMGNNFTSINLFWLGESNYKPTVKFSAYNWTSAAWETLVNNLTLSATALASQPSGADEMISNAIALGFVNTTTGILWLQMNVSRSSSFQLWNNFLNLQVVSKNGTIHELKGSGEMHVNTWFEGIESNLSNFSMVTAESVWNYTTRNLTFYPSESDLTNYSQIQEMVWNYSGNITFSLLEQIVSSVWNYIGRYTHGVII